MTTITADNIITVARLYAIKPGERFRYYRGDFQDDIARAEEHNKKTDEPQTPKYAAVLRKVRETARLLELRDKIKLVKEPVEVRVRRRMKDGPELTLTLKLTDYIAVGV